MNIVALVQNPAAAQPDLRSVAQCLRNLADTIDAGRCGEVLRAAIVLRCSGMEPIVCGQGDAEFAQTFMDLHAGAAQLMSMHSPERS